MRRSIARGRVFPQSFSTDRRYGRLSLKAIAIFPLMWVNGDDQGRLSGDPEEIKYAVCPNVDHITKKDIPELLKELEDNKLILCYDTPKSAAIQILDWWDTHQKLQWAWPSEYQPPEGWRDHLRYKRDAHTVETLNWPVLGEHSGEHSKVSQVSEVVSSGERSGEQLGREIRAELIHLPSAVDNLAEHEAVKQKLAQLGEQRGFLVRSEVTTPTGRIDLVWEEGDKTIAAFEVDIYEPKAKSLTKLTALGCQHPFVILRTNPTPLQLEQGILLIGLGKEREGSEEKEKENVTEEENVRGRGRGNSPESSGEEPSPSPTVSPVKLLNELIKCYRIGWGTIRANEPDKVIPRPPDARIDAQLRDLANELSSAGGCPLEYIGQAFKEAAGQGKYHVSYVRAVLLDWLGLPRNPPR